ncbi:MAG: right-handed parallel beta-helix repeat-containing protein [Candidatus Pacebacteria bacterium]|nr:right-handed parallel beta-helix repeat-containing protein [Candidatus Paceibacterota bacterium]
MKKILLSVFLAFASLSFFTPSALAADSACSGGSGANTTSLSPQSGENNQDQINTAIQNAPIGGTIFLKAGTYIISHPIVLRSNIILEGEKDKTIIQLKDHANWKTVGHAGAQSILDPMIGGGAGLTGVEIKCFTVDGNFNFRQNSGGGNVSSGSAACYRPLKWDSDFSNCESQYVDRYSGRGYYTMIYFSNGSNLSVHDMTMQDGANDAVKVNKCSDIRFYNNYVNASGHEGLYALYSHGIEAYGNKIAVRSSDGIRGDNCSDFSIHDNEMYSYNSADSSAGVQIADKGHSEYPVFNVQIFRNVFHDIWRSGIWFSTAIAKYNGKWPVEVHHNLFVGNGYSRDSAVGATGGITNTGGSAAVVYNNTFDGNFGSGIYDGKNTMKILNNIVVGTTTGKYSAAGTGVGIQGGSEVTYNVFYNNVKDATVSGTGNFNGNPLFYNPGEDYHLLSMAGRWNPASSSWTADQQNSPAIDAGVPQTEDSVYGDYSNEPEENGDRVNAGVYGNTSQASLTGIIPQEPMPPAPEPDLFSTVEFSDGTASASTGESVGTSGETTNLGDYIPGTGSGGVGTGSFTEMDMGNGDNDAPDYYDSSVAMTAISSGDSPESASATSAEGAYVAPYFPELGSAAESATAACSIAKESGGLVPCGRNTDDPDTDWNECDKCGLCSVVLMGQLIIQFLMKMAGITAILAIIFAGFLYIYAVGRSDVISKAKSMIKYVLIGFTIVFSAWVIVNTILTLLGYIDPLGGEWYTMC